MTELLRQAPGQPGRFQRVEVPSLGGRGRALVDFGASGAVDARTVITGQAAITASSVPAAWIIAVATATHTADEHRIEDIDVVPGDIVPGVGFTIHARTRTLRLFGAYSVAWQWS